MSGNSVEFVPGPLVSEFTREAAEAGLRQNKKFGPKIANGAAYALEQLEGRWVAAIVVNADSPFGGPADQAEEAPGPKSEGPNDTAPESEGPPSPEGESPEDTEGLEGPPSEGDSEGDKSKGKDGKGGKEEQIIQMLDALFQGLGIPNPSDALGGDPSDPSGGMPPLGPGGPDNVPPPPPGIGGSAGPDGGSAHGAPGDQHIIHEKALKPGEVPPGGTPIGAPAFSHVRENHPWKHVAGKVASIPTEQHIGNRPISDVHAELVSLTNELGGGYRVAQLEEAIDPAGERIARAVISMH
jgi:hypothetical protein